MSTNLFALMRQFTVRTRMLGAIAVVLVLLALVGGAGMFGIFRIHQISNHVIEESLTMVDRVDSLRDVMGQVRRYEKEMIIQYEKPDQIRVIRTRWESDMQLIDTELGSLKDILPSYNQPHRWVIRGMAFYNICSQ